MIEGKVVRTATGPNDKPGGTEQLDWAAWDVRELAGQTAVLRIVDHETGGWGHINVDQIVQSDRRQGAAAGASRADDRRAALPSPARSDKTPRCAGCASRPAGGSSASLTSSLPTAGPISRSSSILQPFQGQTLALETELPAGSKALEQITARD